MKEDVSGFDHLVTGDRRLDAPAFHRNVQPILSALTQLLPQQDAANPGHVVEVGSGTGQHAAAFATAFPGLTWWPTDPLAVHRQSIDAWRHSAGIGNLMPAGDLDIEAEDWELGAPARPPAAELDAIIAINVVHITPWSVSLSLIAAAGKYLGPNGVLVLYGPFSESGRHNAESNARFDQSLRARDPSWGVRDVDDLGHLAEQHGLGLAHRIACPSNNHVLGFRRGISGDTLHRP